MLFFRITVLQVIYSYNNCKTLAEDEPLERLLDRIAYGRCVAGMGSDLDIQGKLMTSAGE